MTKKDEISLWILLGLSLCVLFAIIFHLVKDFIVIQKDNEKLLDGISSNDKEEIMHAHELNTATVGNEEYNLGGANDED